MLNAVDHVWQRVGVDRCEDGAVACRAGTRRDRPKSMWHSSVNVPEGGEVSRAGGTAKSLNLFTRKLIDPPFQSGEHRHGDGLRPVLDFQWDFNATIADSLWSSPGNWLENPDGFPAGRVPNLDDEVRIDVPSAAAPNGPVIQDGDTAQALGIFTEAAGEPTLTMTGGTLEVADWVWWGDGPDSFATWYMEGGDVTVGDEFELGWGGGAGTLEMTGGSITAARFKLPADDGAFSQANLHGGTFTVTNEGGLRSGTPIPQPTPVRWISRAWGC